MCTSLDFIHHEIELYLQKIIDFQSIHKDLPLTSITFLPYLHIYKGVAELIWLPRPYKKPTFFTSESLMTFTKISIAINIFFHYLHIYKDLAQLIWLPRSQNKFLTSESLMTFTNVSVDVIDACCVVLARIRDAFIHVNFTCFT